VAPVAKESWFVIRVELAGRAGEEIDPPPGRDFLASSEFSLLQLGVAIDYAFARWDLGHLHLFRMPAGEEYMLGGDEDGDPSSSTESVSLGQLGLTQGTTFEYVFDLGDEWRHRCQVLPSTWIPTPSSETSRSPRSLYSDGERSPTSTGERPRTTDADPPDPVPRAVPGRGHLHAYPRSKYRISSQSVTVWLSKMICS
jgi:hypothetical protein